jgi:alkanesulfonate monooxygenase SsuD/methylene tetrahydromethanopterin reductase-like flavin-dependent oxidoreductase (luciferase family)
MLESLNTLSFVAGKTERFKLGTMVTGVTSRYSDVLIKTATTLDVFSGGPTSASAPEGSSSSISHSGFPSHRSGSDLMLEETLQIALPMWAENTEPYNGPYCHLAEPINVPNSVQRPHPPILTGGGGERKTLRLVARYEDACNFFADPPGAAQARRASRSL